MSHQRALFVKVAWRALGETLALESVLLVALLSFTGQVLPNVMGQGVLLLVTLCGLWFGLRAPLFDGKWYLRLVNDLINTAAFTIAMGLWATMLVAIFNLRLVYLSTNIGRSVDLFYPIGRLIFLCVRFTLWGWGFWGHLRRRKLVWSLTHAQLTVVIVVVLIVAMSLSIRTIFDASRQFSQEATSTATFLDRLVLTIFPLTGITVIFVLLTLAIVLPPAALVSFWIARRITRRLDLLADAAQALRAGHYDARVVVSGQDEVAQLQSDFNAMAQELDNTLAQLSTERDKVSDLLDVRRNLTASISHELRTPVATVRSYLEPLLERRMKALPDELQAELKIIDREVNRLERLIDDLFTLAQADVDKLELRVKPVDTGKVAVRIVDTPAPLAWSDKRVELVCEVASGLVTASADEGRLEQILFNLLRNAIRHTSPGGIVALEVKEQKGFIRMDVRDTGTGISADELPHIWERFYRIPATYDGEKVQGAGLGLALVKELVEAMDGTVAVESQLSTGSCFSIFLPIFTRDTSQQESP